MARRCLPPHEPDPLQGRGRRGFTIAELLLGIMITSIVGLGVATMLYSASHGTSSQSGLRGVLIGQETASLRLDAVLRVTRTVLAKGDDYLVLWTGETWGNEAPDLSELIRIEHNAAGRELTCYRAPAGLAAEDDIEYDLLTTDFNSVTSQLRGSASFPGELWAVDVTSWSAALDTADCRQAGFVGYRITLTVDGISDTTVGGMALRNR